MIDYVIARTVHDRTEYLTNYRGDATTVARVWWGGLRDCLILTQQEVRQVKAFLGRGCCRVLRVGVDVQV